MRQDALKAYPFKPPLRFQAQPKITVADNFNRADETPLSGGGNWTTTTHHLNLASNAVSIDTTDAGNNQEAVYASWTGTNDHYSQADATTTGSPGGAAGIGVSVRSTSSGTNENCYFCVIENSAGNLSTYKVVNNSFTQLRQDVVTYVAGAIVKLQISGTTLTVFYNKVQIGGTITDSAISSGKPGLFYSSNLTTGKLDNWVAADL